MSEYLKNIADLAYRYDEAREIREDFAHEIRNLSGVKDQRVTFYMLQKDDRDGSETSREIAFDAPGAALRQMIDGHMAQLDAREKEAAAALRDAIAKPEGRQ